MRVVIRRQVIKVDDNNCCKWHRALPESEPSEGVADEVNNWIVFFVLPNLLNHLYTILSYTYYLNRKTQLIKVPCIYVNNVQCSKIFSSRPVHDFNWQQKFLLLIRIWLKSVMQYNLMISVQKPHCLNPFQPFESWPASTPSTFYTNLILKILTVIRLRYGLKLHLHKNKLNPDYQKSTKDSMLE